MIRDHRQTGSVERLYREYFREKDSPSSSGRNHLAPAASPRTDEEVVEKLRSERGEKAEQLWNGDVSEYGGDHSSADDGFIHKLYFYTQDQEQIKRIHAMSGLHRPEKSGRRADYLQRSIDRAAKNVTQIYDWRTATLSLNGSRDDKKKKHSAAPREGVAAERKIRWRTAREVAAETPAQTEWCARPYVARGTITEVDGKIKAGGKTTWVSHMAACILDGRPFMGEPTKKTRILFLTEQPPASFRKVLERAGLTGQEDLYILCWHDVAGMLWPEVARHAVIKAEEVEAGVLFVDTLGQFAGIAGDRENSAGDAMEAMRPLQEAAAKNLAVVLTRHERKGGGEVGESGRGSSAFGGAVDIILSIRRAEGNVRPTVRVIESLSRFEETPDKLVIELTPTGYRSLGDATAFAEKEARGAILETLPAKPENAIATGDLLDKLKEQGVKRTSAQDALHTLTESGAIERIGGGKRGDPYRYHRGEKDSAATTSPSGGKNPGGAQDEESGADSGDSFLSAGTPSLYTAERKSKEKPASDPYSRDRRGAA